MLEVYKSIICGTIDQVVFRSQIIQGGTNMDFLFPSDRNNFDRVGHFLVGILAYPIAELFSDALAGDRFDIAGRTL